MDARNLLHILTWPFHNGLRDVSMGSGPIRLATDDEFRAGIEAEGWTVSTEEIEPGNEGDPEIARTTALIRRLAGRVADAVSKGAFPLALAGNCNSALGTRAGIGAENLEEYRRERLARSDVKVIPGQIDPDRFQDAGKGLQPPRVYLYVDLDSLDIDEARANKYAAPGGPSLTRLVDCIRAVTQHHALAGAAITAYDPAFDRDDRAITAARAIAREIAEGARPQPTSGTG